MTKFPLRQLTALGLVLTSSLGLAAPVLVTSANQTYNQDFNSLTTATTAQTWANGSTLNGWHLFTAAGTAITTYTGGTGASNAGSFYSFGATGNAERALGGVASGGTYFGSPSSGALAGYIALELKNSSGTALGGFSLGFNGEQWRNGGNTSGQVMVFEYGFGSTFSTVNTWTTPGGNFDWTSPVTGAAAAAVDGNLAGRVAARGGNINVTWNPNDTLWLRWVERNDVGNDHGLAIDDLQFTSGSAPAPVPVPPAFGLLGCGAAALYRLARRRASGATA